MYQAIDHTLGSTANHHEQATVSLSRAIDVNETNPALPEHGTMGLGLFQGLGGRVWSALSEVMDDDTSVTLLRF